jgi:hypothetical protein
VLTEMLVYHRRFDDRRGDYRYSNRAPARARRAAAMTAEEYVARPGPAPRTPPPGATGSAEHRIDAVVEPTIPIVARCAARLRRAVRRPRRSVADALLGLDGFPVVALPSGVGVAERPAHERLADRRARRGLGLLAWGAALQAELGTVSP